MTKTFATAALALAAIALPLGAAHASEGRSVSISYADLDLSSQAGQEIFDRRIERAVQAVCGTMQGRPSLDAAVRKCQQETQVSANKSRDLAIANYGRTQLAGADREIRLVIR
ncbi:UrcA family protein [Erythrobacter sp. NAP1]|uniref:UrcA family protein n=1 Tax=Erythrobacter sp. NAP1 TaxID=237727 RepID=UPI0002FF237D|nr:UrcA family protein [Erythrobacter sp. NAP1]